MLVALMVRMSSERVLDLGMLFTLGSRNAERRGIALDTLGRE
jgi:hypothetical protein